MRPQVDVGGNIHHMWFVCDDKNGGCIVECGKCKFTFNEHGLKYCPQCNEELRYPKQASW